MFILCNLFSLEVVHNCSAHFRSNSAPFLMWRLESCDGSAAHAVRARLHGFRQAEVADLQTKSFVSISCRIECHTDCVETYVNLSVLDAVGQLHVGSSTEPQCGFFAGDPCFVASRKRSLNVESAHRRNGWFARSGTEFRTCNHAIRANQSNFLLQPPCETFLKFRVHQEASALADDSRTRLSTGFTGLPRGYFIMRSPWCTLINGVVAVDCRS